MDKIIRLNKIRISNSDPLVLIAGPCVIENKEMTLRIAKELKKITLGVGVPFIFKASYDKANRTSIYSFRGLGIKKGLNILREVKETVGVPVLSDIHSVQDAAKAKDVLDVIQIPAFLCRQTDLLVAAAETGKIINIKKGQFLAPWDMKEVIRKVESKGNKNILLTERGVTFGYNNLVSDFRSLAIMKQTGYPVAYDASHSVQQPGGLGRASGGTSEFIPVLARCGVAVGCSAVFIEVHMNPKKALSDGPNMLTLKELEKLLVQLKAIDNVVKKHR